MNNTIMIRFKYGLLIGLMSFIFTSCDQEKTAYVDNTELIQSYHKMKKAKE